MSVITATFTTAGGSVSAWSAQTPPVFDPAWIVAGGAIPAAPTTLWHVSPTGTPSPGIANGSRAAPYSAAQMFMGVLGQPYALISTMPAYFSNALGAHIAGGSASSPVKPGHGIVLIADPVTGNAAFGNLLLQAQFGTVTAPGLNNGTNFIWVMQDPDVTLATFTLIAGAGWIFHGLDFVSDQADMPQADRVFDQMVLGGPLLNIIVANCSFQSRTPFSNLTAAEAIASGPVYGINLEANYGATPAVVTQYVTFANNTFFHVQNGICFAGSQVNGGPNALNHVRACYNECSQHLFDGIDWNACFLEIDHNYIHDRLNGGVSYHPDFLQGQPWNSSHTTVGWMNEINIHHNVGVLITVPGLIWESSSSANVSQGMDYWNGSPTNVTFANNLVLTSINGIALYGGTGLVVENNTVLNLGLYPATNPAITIYLQSSSEVPTGGNSAPQNITVNNNLGNQITIADAAINWTASGNVVIQSGVPASTMAARIDYAVTVGGATKDDWVVGTPNPIGTVSALTPAQVFTKWDPVNFVFDTTPVAGLPPYIAPGLGAPPWSNTAPRSANWPFK